VTFSVAQGEVFGILGPNGAGKTTTLEIVEGLRRPDTGGVTLLGLDVVRSPRAVHALIGVQPQASALFDNLTVRETLDLFAALYPRSTDLARLIDRLALGEKRNARVKNLSGGQRQRLSVMVALVNEPQVVFLDEPTTGLDPQARRELWSLVREMRDEGMTIVLTTHYMEEAEQLCDRVAIIDLGRIVATDAPRALIRQLGFQSTVECHVDAVQHLDQLRSLPGVQSVQSSSGTFILATSDVSATIAGLFRFADKSAILVRDMRVRTASLEDVFIGLTGRQFRD
jgi:ABC-2 type transport system ATP-binding protein